jgi:hypothetical protein
MLNLFFIEIATFLDVMGILISRAVVHCVGAAFVGALCVN